MAVPDLFGCDTPLTVGDPARPLTEAMREAVHALSGRRDRPDIRAVVNRQAGSASRHGNDAREHGGVPSLQPLEAGDGGPSGESVYLLDEPEAALSVPVRSRCWP